MRQPRATRVAIVMLAGLCASWAQEQSVRPGVNANFEKIDDVERYVKMFEGDGRAIYNSREAIVRALGLKKGMDVADVGAGTGFFSYLFAEKIGEKGTVYAVDIAEEFIALIDKTAAEKGIANVKTLLCTADSTNLGPNSIDAAFVCDVYHHFEFPYKSLASIHQALRDGGTLMIVDFERINGVTTPFSIEHVRCGKGTVMDEIKDSGFDFVKEFPIMKEQYVITFKKRNDAPAPAK